MSVAAMTEDCCHLKRYSSCERCPHAGRPSCHQPQYDLELGPNPVEDDDVGWAGLFAGIERLAEPGDRPANLFTLLQRVHEAYEFGGPEPEFPEQENAQVEAETAFPRYRAERRLLRQIEVTTAVQMALESQRVPTHWRLVHRIVSGMAPGLRATEPEVYEALTSEKPFFRSVQPHSGVYELVSGI